MTRTAWFRRPPLLLHGFTLVELLVVIAIMGVLMSLLLPAVNSAREAARRAQCMNHVRSVGQAVLNLESAFRSFPSGGVTPWPRIEDYSANGRPFGPASQGLSWAFQILPFLEEDAVHGLTTTLQIADSPIGMYFCPSRRPPTAYMDGATTYWLLDYTSLNPIPTRAQIGAGVFNSHMRIIPGRPTRGCRKAFAFWGTRTYGNDHEPVPKSSLGFEYVGFNGAIVRSSYYVDDGQVVDLNYGAITTVNKVKDGLSKTSLVGEKRIRLGDKPSTPTTIAAGRMDGISTPCARLRVNQRPTRLSGEKNMRTPSRPVLHIRLV